jgi:hypothetical protein
MQKYIKTFRVVSLVFLIPIAVSVLVATVGLTIEDGKPEYLGWLLTLIPLYMSINYILITAKGETAMEQLSTKAKKTILYSNMIAFATLILAPMLFGVFALKTWSDAGNASTWDVTNAYGETITVTTKLEERTVKYLFDSKYDKPAFGRLSRHEIKLLDKDGFTLWSSDVAGYTLKESSDGMVTGVSAEGKGEDYLDLFDYAKASTLKVEFYK